LIAICKSYGRNKKIEKKKRKEKYINGPREPDLAQQRKGACGPVANRSGIFSFSLISLTCGPYVSALTPSSSRNPLLLPLWQVTPVITHSNLAIKCPSFKRYKRPSTPPSPLSFPPEIVPPGCSNCSPASAASAGISGQIPPRQ
jgi:hypothetical protein